MAGATLFPAQPTPSCPAQRDSAQLNPGQPGPSKASPVPQFSSASFASQARPAQPAQPSAGQNRIRPAQLLIFILIFFVPFLILLVLLSILDARGAWRWNVQRDLILLRLTCFWRQPLIRCPTLFHKQMVWGFCARVIVFAEHHYCNQQMINPKEQVQQAGTTIILEKCSSEIEGGVAC